MANDYKVLYRKYRPTSFDEVIGQNSSISMLKNAVVNDKISHAYIFTGPRGTGKTSTAKIFAKTINCEHPQDGIPCGKCHSCVNIQNNADIIEIDAASNNGVDEVRELINNVKIAPSMAKYKVYIIDEVHMLSQSAFNALLLTLEEPPGHIVFILATTNIESVPITILSRCQRYDFKKISFDELKNHLFTVCEKENIDITDDAIDEIVYLSEGGCRDALSILNQLSTSNSKIDIDVVLKNYGSVSLTQIKKVVLCFLEDNFDELKVVFDDLQSSSVDYKVFLKKMIDLLFNEALNCKKQRDEVQFAKIKSAILELNDLINKVNITINPFLLIFLILSEKMGESLEKNENVENREVNLPIEKEVAVKLEKISKEQKNEKAEISKEEDTLKQVLNEKKETKISPINENWLLYFEKLKEIRLNNCFAEADKNLLTQFKDKWSTFNESISLTNAIKPSIMDANVVLASSKINILTHMQVSMVELFNNELLQIESEYRNIIGDEIHFLALSVEEWDKSKMEYISRLKEHYVYTIIAEPIYEEENDSSDKEIQENDTPNLILDIFDKGKIEVQ